MMAPLLRPVLLLLIGSRHSTATQVDAWGDSFDHDGPKYQRRCLRAIADSGFNFFDFDHYDKWFHENSTVQIAVTGTYTGPDEIKEYVSGPAAYFEYYFDVQSTRMLPLGFTRNKCKALFVTAHRMQTDPAKVGGAYCVETMFAYTVDWTVRTKEQEEEEDRNTGIRSLLFMDVLQANKVAANETTTSSPSNTPSTQPMDHDDGDDYDQGTYDFKVDNIMMYYSTEFIKRMFGTILGESPQVRDFVCNTILGPGCNETASLNGLDTHQECAAQWEDLPSAVDTGRIDGNTKGCRILHNSFAITNPKHCPHLSFVAQEDFKGRVKCQKSKNLQYSDLYSRQELSFIQQASDDWGYGSSQWKGTCDLMPTLLNVDLKAYPRGGREQDSSSYYKDPFFSKKSNEFFKLHIYDPPIPCADGSPAGIYVEQNPKVTNSKNHVILFIGGAACADSQDCDKGYRMEPFKFGTDLLPDTLEGHTILSRDPAVNPALHDYTKWLVPYCSQDFFLGDPRKGKVGNFTHAGSLIFDAALKYWQTQATARSYGSAQFDNVVVVGLSAGSIGVMNKITKIRDTINTHQKNLKIETQNLKIMLDSPSAMTDLETYDKNFKQAMLTYTDLKEHPLCHPLNPLTRGFERMSALPCCLSTHCMLRLDPRYSSFYDLTKPTATNHSFNEAPNEELLILDSAYDPLALMASFNTSSFGEAVSASELTNDLYGQVELAGNRKTRGLETATLTKLAAARKFKQEVSLEEAFPEEPRVKWIFTSCYQHVFTVPAAAILKLNCEAGNYDTEDYDFQCSDDGHAFEFDDGSFKMRVWRTTDTWNLVDFRGESMQGIITNFMQGNFSERPSPGMELDTVTALLTFETPDVIDFRLEPCEGPNCLPNDAPDTLVPSCQALIEVEDYFVSVPHIFIILWVMALLLLFFSALYLRIDQLKCLQKCTTPSNGDQPGDIPWLRRRSSVFNFGKEPVSKKFSTDRLKVDNIRVVVADGKTLVDGVKVCFKTGTLNALTGRSGAGKSSLLKAMSALNQPGVTVTYGDGGAELEAMPKAFLRQHDDSEGFGKLVPNQYLMYTADIIGCSDEKLEEVFNLTYHMFERPGAQRKQEDGKPEGTSFNPFLSTPIANLSGGQRRILNIATTLLSEPKLLLLDEPLSGLDSASCLEVMEALSIIARKSCCIVLMTVHQPSITVLEQYEKLVVMREGRIVYEEQVKEVGAEQLHYKLENQMLSEAVEGLRRSNTITPTKNKRGSSAAHQFNRRLTRKLEERALKTYEDMYPMPSMSERGSDESNSETALDSLIFDFLNPDDDQEDITDDISTKGGGLIKRGFVKICKQIGPMARRLHPQYGWEFASGVVLILGLSFMSGALLRFENFYPQQVVMFCMMLVGIPSVMFPHKVVEHAHMWKAHQNEIDDGKISLLAFQASTSLYTFPVPLFAFFIGQVLAYFLVGYSFDSFVYQWVISSVHLMVSLQLGRGLMVWCRAQYSQGIRMYTGYLVYAFLFNGVTVNMKKLPHAMHWMYWFSINFWGISGSVMKQLDDANYSNVEECTDLISCLTSDGNVLVHILGFAPTSNSLRALGILTVLLLLGMLWEYVGLWRHCAGIRKKPTQSKGEKKKESKSQGESTTEGARLCTSCGTKHPLDANFCPGCGHKIEKQLNIKNSGRPQLLDCSKGQNASKLALVEEDNT